LFHFHNNYRWKDIKLFIKKKKKKKKRYLIYNLLKIINIVINNYKSIVYRNLFINLLINISREVKKKKKSFNLCSFIYTYIY